MGTSDFVTVIVNSGQVTLAPLPAGGSTATVGGHVTFPNTPGSMFNVPGGGTTVIGAASATSKH
jgi:hypothetical protein